MFGEHAAAYKDGVGYATPHHAHVWPAESDVAGGSGNNAGGIAPSPPFPGFPCATTGVCRRACRDSPVYRQNRRRVHAPVRLSATVSTRHAMLHAWTRRYARSGLGTVVISGTDVPTSALAGTMTYAVCGACINGTARRTCRTTACVGSLASTSQPSVPIKTAACVLAATLLLAACITRIPARLLATPSDPWKMGPSIARRQWWGSAVDVPAQPSAHTLTTPAVACQSEPVAIKFELCVVHIMR